MSLLSLLFPERCSLCGNPLSEKERFVCDLCLAELPRTRFHNMNPNPMELRFAGLAPVKRGTALLFYSREGNVAQLVQDFKYRHMPSLAEKLGALSGRELFMTGFFSDIDVIFPIPVHFTKRMKRGYNQTEFLARGLGEELRIPVSLDLRARRSHSTQTRKSILERRENTAGIFRLRHPERYAGKRVLIVDDVCTTGATLVSAANVVHEAGAEVSVFTLGVTL